MVINTNIMSLNSQRQLNMSGSAVAQATERLSSGLRINSAKDDAAGLAISNRMSSQVRGLNQAIRNANDGISMSQTAEGAMQEITNNLQRVRELAVQAANASNTASDRQSLNEEVTQLVAEINRAATQTTFNGRALLDGTFNSQQFQIGMNKNENLSFTISNMQANALGVGSSSSYSTSVTGSEVTATALTAGDMTINGYDIGAAVDDGVSLENWTTATVAAVDAAASGIAVANIINASSGDTGVTAAVNATTLAGAAITAGATAVTAGQIRINGVDLGAIAGDASAAVKGSNVAAAVNAVSDQTGVTATYNGTTGAVALTASDGRNISIEFAAGTSALASGITGLGAAGSSVIATDVTRATVDLSSTGSAGIVIGGALESNAGYTSGSTAATATAGAGVSSIDISTVAGAENALAIIDSALSRVDTERAELGAIQNRLDSTMANLSNVSENVSAARSRIRDADFAAETAALTRAQILQQAGVAMLAQANAQPQTVLSLLQ